MSNEQNVVSTRDIALYELSDHQKSLLQDTKGVIFYRLGEKTTACLVTVVNSFEIVGTSACEDVANFDGLIGERCALYNALDKLGEHLSFWRQGKSYESLLGAAEAEAAEAPPTE